MKKKTRVIKSYFLCYSNYKVYEIIFEQFIKICSLKNKCFQFALNHGLYKGRYIVRNFLFYSFPLNDHK